MIINRTVIMNDNELDNWSYKFILRLFVFGWAIVGIVSCL